MPVPNVFRSNIFTETSLTASILDLPHVPARIFDLGLFIERGVSTTEVWVEEKAGQLRLLQTSPRGAPPAQHFSDKRKARSFRVPHITLESTIYADQIQDVRSFGSETTEETTQMLINEHLEDMKRQHEVTHEHMRVGALRGQILDANGDVIYDLFDEFGVAQQTQDFDFENASAKIRTTCLSVQRAIEDELGATPSTGMRAICGRDFFDALISHPDAERAYERFQAGEMLRNDPRAAFPFGGIQFEEYRGQVNGRPYVPRDQAYVFPEGTDLFIKRNAPADFMSTVNTIGLPLYAKSEIGDMERSITLHTQSNPLPLNLRPRTVVKCSIAGASAG